MNNATGGQTNAVTEDKTSFMWDVHKYTNDYIRFADTKAAFIAGIDAALIGTAVSSSLYDSRLHQNPNHWSAVVWMGVAGILALGISIGFCVATVVPRRWHNVIHGYIYWDSVLAHGSAKQFIQAFDSLTLDGMTHELTNHVYVLASIAAKKYRAVREAIRAGIAGWVLTGISVLLQHALK